ncbi:MAG: GntR family transcriptional regulator [Coprobacillaceae bacterium]
MQINQNSNIPIYEQIYEQFLDYISKGILQTGEKLPSVRELSSQMHINPNTVVKAYRMLEEQKFIHSLPGKGSFVSEKQQSQTENLKKNIIEECKKLITTCKYIDMPYEELCGILKASWEE